MSPDPKLTWDFNTQFKVFCRWSGQLCLNLSQKEISFCNISGPKIFLTIQGLSLSVYGHSTERILVHRMYWLNIGQPKLPKYQAAWKKPIAFPLMWYSEGRQIWSEETGKWLSGCQGRGFIQMGVETFKAYENRCYNV